MEKLVRFKSTACRGKSINDSAEIAEKMNEYYVSSGH